MNRYIALPLRLLAAAVLAATLVIPGAVFAQGAEGPPEASPTREQQSLNDEAVRSIIERDYARAVALLEEALLIGELNVTYYNLATAYDGLDQCRKAKQALEAAETAPQVDTPSPERLGAKVAELRAELPEACPRADEDIQLPPGGDGDQTATGSSSSAPIYLFAGAAVLAGAGTTMHLLARGDRNEVRDAIDDDGRATGLTYPEAQRLEQRANTLDTVAIGAFAAGGIATAAGLYVLFRDDAAKTRSAPAQGASLQLGADSIVLQIRGSF